MVDARSALSIVVFVFIGLSSLSSRAHAESKQLSSIFMLTSAFCYQVLRLVRKDIVGKVTNLSLIHI